MNGLKKLQAVSAMIILAAAAMAGAPEEKIAITTSSSEALTSFREGRTLVDNLRLTDAIDRFKHAVEGDANFALAYLYLAQTAPTAKEFFAYLDKATSLEKNASEGERLWIDGFRAGTYADPQGQRKAYQKLVDLFPNDERAQTLLGIYYFGQQDYRNSAVCLEKAVAISPGFAPAYNQLGYAYKLLNQFDKAEKSYTKYIELIPGDPNPYDSYAELLLKQGRFNESIAQYRRALSADPHFANSFAGIAAALMYQGKHTEAREELDKAYSIARNDGERRAALFTGTIVSIDEGNLEKALKEFDKQYALGESIHDAAAMSGDLTSMGNIQFEMGRYDDALSSFEKSLTTIKSSNLANEVKENAKLLYHFNAGKVAVGKKDYAAAWKEADQFMTGAEAKKNSNLIRLAHELAGLLALEQKEYDKAIKELLQSSQQNPYNLFRLAHAYRETGNKDEARKMCTAAAHFNALPFMNYAFIRAKSEKLLSAI